MATGMHEWFLLIFTLWMALQLGGGLYEKQVIVPIWSKAPMNQLQKVLDQTGQKSSATRFWMFVSPWVAILSLINFYIAWGLQESPLRTWWMSAAGVSVAYSTFTYSYFVPQMIRLWSANSIPEAKARKMTNLWTRLNWIRLAMGFAAFISALEALRLVGNFPSS